MNKTRRIFFFLTVFLTLLAGGMVGVMFFLVETPKDIKASMPWPVSSQELSAVPEDKQESNTENPPAIVNPEGKTL